VWQRLNYFLQADVIHIHDVFFWILPIYIILKIFGKKIFITFHGYEGINNPKFRQIFWHRLAEMLCKGSIAIGGFHQKWYGTKSLIISFGAVDQVATKSIRARNTDITKIIFAGRLGEDVGIMTYLRALLKLSSTQNVTLDVYGDGPQMVTARSFVIKHRLPVKFLGFVPHSDIPWYEYQVAFVSRYLAMLEAFTAELPVIAHYNVEIKRDYLLLSPFRNWICVGGNTAQIVNCWQTIKLNTWAKNTRQARSWARRQTWHQMANNYLRLWGWQTGA
jgi:glycosyltransferase involved in cell wall biosynthesis